MKSSDARFRFRHGIGVVIAVLLLGLLVTPAFADNPATGTTTTDQELTVEIMVDPVMDGMVWLDGTPILASAWANLGEGDFANIVYVVDLSGSMENASFNPFQDLNPPAGIGPEDDCNGDGIEGSAMDAACFGLISLNESLDSAPNVDVGIVAFGEGAQTADMDPSAATEPLTSPPDVDNGGLPGPDVEQVIRSLDTEFGDETAPGGIGQFTNQIAAGFPSATDYNAGLTAMNAIFTSEPADDINVAFFLSDGNPTSGRFTTGPGSPLASVPAGAKVNTFALGSIAPGSCASGQPLRTIADDTGGSCTEVSDPSALSTVLPAALTRIASLNLRVNGTIVGSQTGSEPVSMHVEDIDINGVLMPGVNTIEATAVTEDGTEVTADFEVIGVPHIDLSVTKTDSPDPVIAGTDLTYTVEVANNSPWEATGVTVTDTLPSGVVYDDGASSVACDETPAGSGTVVCTIGSLAGMSSTAATLVVHVPSSTADGAVLSNEVEVAGNEEDPDLTNNTTTEDTDVIRRTDLAITKTDSPDPVPAGGELTYTIEVANNGPSDASGITVTDTLPAGVSFVSASSGCSESTPGMVTCDVGDLVNGDSTTLTIVVTATCDAVGGITNTAEVAGNETDPDLSNNTATEDTAVLADFGDADDPPYPTKYSSGGAYHCDFTHEWLGVGVDGEPDAKFPDLFDDGVFPHASYATGELASLPILVSTSGEGPARYGPQADRRIYVQGWIDFDKDGNWSTSEQVFTCNVGPSTVGHCNGEPADWLNMRSVEAFTVRFNVPIHIDPPVDTWMRVRLSYGTLVGPTGSAEYGEVEDYPVNIVRYPLP